MASIDQTTSRKATKVYLKISGKRVGRVQSFQESVTNNVQVISELGREFAVELRKGITVYTFSIARFFTRADALASLKHGAIFSLEVLDGENANRPESLTFFRHCSITAISHDYQIGQAVVAENASVVTIGDPHGKN